MRQVVDFPDPVREDLVGRDQVFRRHGGRIGERQRRSFHRPADRAPDIDLDNPGAGSGQTGHLLLAEHVLRALRSALGGIVDMQPARRTAPAVRVLRPGTVVGAPRDVEDDDLGGAEPAPQECLDLRVIRLLYRLVVVKIADFRRLAQQFESLAIDR